MNSSNVDLKLMAKGNGVPLWKIAMQMNISEQTLIRKWRKELLSEEKEKVRDIIKNLKEGEKNAE